MPRCVFPPSVKFAAAACAAVLAIPLLASAQQAQTIHSFGNGKDGSDPYSGLIADSAGNLYGTTARGGSYHLGYLEGTAFELSPQKDGTWKENILHNFGGRGDGFGPNGNLVLDAAGNLYGVTNAGGSGTGCYQGCGTVFQLRPPSNHGTLWTESVIYTYQDNGVNPASGLVIDSAGNLYGVATEIGISFTINSVVYEVTQSGGTWTENALYSFTSDGAQGLNPNGPLVFDASGNLYGTTNAGGAHGHGTVFELSPQGDGTWQEKTLHSFRPGSGDGAAPAASVIFHGGNLYGTTGGGGTYNLGTVFELAPSSDGSWTESILYNFGANAADGSLPGSILFDRAGNLYGQTEFGGTYNYGTLFKLTPGQGAWTEQILHQFDFTTDGGNPWGSLVLSPSGSLYGACTGGGRYYNSYFTDPGGTAFEIKLK